MDFGEERGMLLQTLPSLGCLLSTFEMSTRKVLK